ncbi:hypothetical protein H0H92_009526 [Tricholoma furcatifolium]|nr:hypothetical protein H0H92_009526 [Tricholoma furcatifolium]
MSYASLSADDIRDINLNAYLGLSAFTLLIYEYSITFRLEVERFWITSSKRPPWSTIFFFLNRYLTIFGHILVLYEYFWYSLSLDKPKIIVSTMLIMRLYALYDRSLRILAILLLTALAVIAVACWGIVTGKAHGNTSNTLPVLYIYGCPPALSHILAIRLAIGWSGMLVFDTLVFALTVYKSFTVRRIRLGVGLFGLLLRDGSMYFGVMIFSNIANILAFIYGHLYTKGSATPYMNVISSILITRLMLNLRDPRITGMDNDENEVIPLQVQVHKTIKTVDITYNVSGIDQSGQNTRREQVDVTLTQNKKVHPRSSPPSRNKPLSYYRDFWDFE